jgi:serine phosphatase RsbU (regulator of sigma subunit)/HAMP domain-containing protein
LDHSHTLGILDSIYQNFFSVCSVVPFVFTLSLAVITLIIPNKSRATLHFGLTYLFLSIFYFGYIIAAMIYHPAAAYHRLITGGIVAIVEIHFILFLSHFAEEKNITFTKKLGIALYIISLSVVAFFIVKTIGSSRIYHFDGHYWDFDADIPSIMIAVMVIVHLVIMLVIGLHKAAVVKSKTRWSVLAITLIVFILISIPAMTNLLSRGGFLGREIYQTTQDLITIMGFFALFVIYMNTTKDRTRLMTKIMSIILAAFLVIFQGLSYFALTDSDRTYDNLRRNDLSLAVKAGYLPRGISYLIGYGQDGGPAKVLKCPADCSKTIDFQSTRSEIYNTAQYERIADLKDLDAPSFNEQLKNILDTDSHYFKGYRNEIESLVKRQPAGINSTNQILSHIRSLQWRIGYCSKKIAGLPDDNFALHLVDYITNTDSMTPSFKSAILDMSRAGRVSGAALKREALKMLAPMNPAGPRCYRTGTDSNRHFTAFMLYDREHRTLFEAGFDYRAYRQFQHPMALKFIIMLAVSLVLIFGGFQLFFLDVLVRPMKRLLDGINEVRSGKDDIVIPIPVLDELGLISHNFNEMTSTLHMSKEVMSDYAENLEKMVQERTEELKKARDSLWSEMELARKMQTILIPRDPAMDGYEITGYMLPAEMVGGDYYDIINADGSDWVVIGDVSGHGVPAGMIMMMAQTSIHTVLAGNPGIRPSALLDQINIVITENIRRLNEEKYMTITVMACVENGVFYTSGMHQDILIYRSHTELVETIKTRGIILGLRDQVNYTAEQMEVRLDPGDVMLLYTDGITESWRKGSVRNHRNPDTDMFGMERLQELLHRNHSRHTGEIRDAILDALAEYQLSDDVTMVVIRRK